MKMSKAVVSVLVYGIYYLVAGLIYVLLPDLALKLFGFPLEGTWILRVAGVLLGLHGYFYVRAARQELTPYFRWTVHGRVAGFVVFAALAVLGLAQPMIILFGVVDLVGAVWTGLVLGTHTAQAR